MESQIMQIEREATRIQMPNFWATGSLTNCYQWLRRRKYKRFALVLQPDSACVIPLDSEDLVDEFGLSVRDSLKTSVYADTARFYVWAYGSLHGPIGQQDAYSVALRLDGTSKEMVLSFIGVAKSYFNKEVAK